MNKIIIQTSGLEYYLKFCLFFSDISCKHYRQSTQTQLIAMEYRKQATIQDNNASTASIPVRPLLFLAGLVVATTLFAVVLDTPAQRASAPVPLEIPAQFTSESQLNDIPAISPEPLLVTIKSGDTLSGIFDKVGLSQQELHRVLEQKEALKTLRSIRPGKQLSFMLGDENKLQTLSYAIDLTQTLEVHRNGDSFQVTMVQHPLERRTRFTNGVINSSLFLAAQKAGLSDKTTMEMADIFGWDIDFALDIRSGDQFTVLYEDLYRDGEKIRSGDILAAEFTNRGKTYVAIRYTNPEGHSGYYSPDGMRMRKAFRRTPVEFSRISSRFGKRFHPILNRMRAHKGVDYAAPTGTPIRATSDGKVIHKGRKGGYGKTVILKHGKRYSTLYAHMSRYGKGLRRGQTVKQGQIIGYVGQSGSATGPHLHYEFRVDGVHRNPLTVRLPKALPIEKKYRKNFKEVAEKLLAQIEQRKGTLVAQLSQPKRSSRTGR